MITKENLVLQLTRPKRACQTIGQKMCKDKFGRKRTIDAEKLKALYKNGLGATDIAKQMGIGRSTVYKLLNETGE